MNLGSSPHNAIKARMLNLTLGSGLHRAAVGSSAPAQSAGQNSIKGTMRIPLVSGRLGISQHAPHQSAHN